MMQISNLVGWPALLSQRIIEPSSGLTKLVEYFLCLTFLGLLSLCSSLLNLLACICFFTSSGPLGTALASVAESFCYITGCNA